MYTKYSYQLTMTKDKINRNSMIRISHLQAICLLTMNTQNPNTIKKKEFKI